MSLTGFADAAKTEMSLADARNKIKEFISTPSSISQAVGSLSAENQLAILADVNNAISKMRATPEEKAAKFVLVNKAVLTAKGSKNKSALLAEVFATVSPEALTVLNERFASELFNRAADPSRTYTDEDFTKIAENTMKVIIERCEKADDAAVREAFAILMFVRASNGTPADLEKKLIALIPSDKAREVAYDEWISPALGRSGVKSYNPMLAQTGTEESVDIPMTVGFLGPAVMEMMFHDLASKVGITTSLHNVDGGTGLPPSYPWELERVPRTMNPDAAFYPSNDRGDSDGGGSSGPSGPGYFFQRP